MGRRRRAKASDKKRRRVFIKKSTPLRFVVDDAFFLVFFFFLLFSSHTKKRVNKIMKRKEMLSWIKTEFSLRHFFAHDTPTPTHTNTTRILLSWYLLLVDV